VDFAGVAFPKKMEVDDTGMEKKIEVLYQRIVNMTVLRPYWVVFL